MEVPEMGYEGSLTEPIFPVLTALTMYEVHEIQAPEDLFPALETINWQSFATPEQVASLVHHDIKRIDIAVEERDVHYEPVWEAMGEHTIDLIALEGNFPRWMEELNAHGKCIFPRFPNIREFTIRQKRDYY
jgi:hypothetical protein